MHNHKSDTVGIAEKHKENRQGKGHLGSQILTLSNKKKILSLSALGLKIDTRKKKATKRWGRSPAALGGGTPRNLGTGTA